MPVFDYADVQLTHRRAYEIKRMLGIPTHTGDESHTERMVAVARAAGESAPAVAGKPRHVDAERVNKALRHASEVTGASQSRSVQRRLARTVFAPDTVANEAMKACMLGKPKPVSDPLYDDLCDAIQGMFAEPPMRLESTQMWNGLDRGMGVEHHPDWLREDDGA